MTHQGYLILHERRQPSRIVYFSLQDGYLRYYASSQCAKQLGEVRLSGCKIVVKAMKRLDGIPHSFFLEARKVHVKDRSYTLGNPTRVELSACSSEARQEWGKALFSWQRYYWRDPRDQEHDKSHSDDLMVKQLLDKMLMQSHESSSNSPSSTASSISAAAKQPLTFLRRNAATFTRSFSLSFPSSLSKSKMDAAAPEKDCEQDKVALAKVNTTTNATTVPPYAVEIAIGNQEETHAY